ncbi:hypothetical protein AHF37_02303 [Paragonimus kellicotti]|nr:hypothetical protein AHF37_02303 [Paragonimus kellicotti]
MPPQNCLPEDTAATLESSIQSLPRHLRLSDQTHKEEHRPDTLSLNSKNLTTYTRLMHDRIQEGMRAAQESLNLSYHSNISSGSTADGQKVESQKYVEASSSGQTQIGNSGGTNPGVTPTSGSFKNNAAVKELEQMDTNTWPSAAITATSFGLRKLSIDAPFEVINLTDQMQASPIMVSRIGNLPIRLASHETNGPYPTLHSWEPAYKWFQKNAKSSVNSISDSEDLYCLRCDHTRLGDSTEVGPNMNPHNTLPFSQRNSGKCWDRSQAAGHASDIGNKHSEPRSNGVIIAKGNADGNLSAPPSTPIKLPYASPASLIAATVDLQRIRITEAYKWFQKNETAQIETNGKKLPTSIANGLYHGIAAAFHQKEFSETMISEVGECNRPKEHRKMSASSPDHKFSEPPAKSSVNSISDSEDLYCLRCDHTRLGDSTEVGPNMNPHNTLPFSQRNSGKCWDRSQAAGHASDVQKGLSLTSISTKPTSDICNTQRHASVDETGHIHSVSSFIPPHYRQQIGNKHSEPRSNGVIIAKGNADGNLSAPPSTPIKLPYASPASLIAATVDLQRIRITEGKSAPLAKGIL